MDKKLELDRLKSLSLEERAKQKEVSLSCSVMTIIFLCGFIPGLYYWFGDSFIFDYYTVSPFWGFVIFTIVGIIVDIVVSYCFSSYWEEYNALIKQANKDIYEKIKSGEGSEEDLFRMKKDYIERKIGKELLTKDEFEWHSNHFCWGCGKAHTSEPKPYVVTKERTESWKEGAMRYTKTFRESGMILICPECHARLTKSDRISAKNGDVAGKVMIGLYAIIIIGVFLSVCISEFSSNDPSAFAAIGGGLFAAFICFGLASSIGQIILLPLASLIALPFMNLKDGDSKTKWSFDEIPQIRKFMNKDLPHTH